MGNKKSKLWVSSKFKKYRKLKESFVKFIGKNRKDLYMVDGMITGFYCAKSYCLENTDIFRENGLITPRNLIEDQRKLN